MDERHFVFAPFRLDPVNQQLWRGAELVALRPKIFAVLRRLLEQAGRLVTREELRAAVWPGTAVSESVLRGTIRELRDVLGDDAVDARFIETVPHRGYRFIAAITTTQPSRTTPASAPSEPAGAPRPTIFVGRDEELARLHAWLEQAMRGTREVVFVTGEPGIGKTALLDSFLASAANLAGVWTARGHCVEHYGSSEAYLPLLEALGQLCRQPGREQVIALLSRHAPTWLAQMPGLIDDAALEAVQRRVQGATRERMLRELAEALEVLTTDNTLVLTLEDLHWSDYSTLDLVSLLAQRRTPARLLLVGTYRPADVIVSGHPLKGMKQELRVHEQCEELPLRLLTDVEVGQYLAARFPRQQLPADLRHAIHRPTEGNPLFVVNVVDYWLSKRVLVETAGEWQLAARVEDAAAGVPESLRQMIEKQLSRLTPDECRLIEVASVAGAEFSAGLVAMALEEDAERVETLCEGLATRDQFLRPTGTEVVADGSVRGRYRFRHALYQQVLYERVAAARRVRSHRRIGEWLEQSSGSQAGSIAAELAMHFERGHDPERAIRYLTDAGDNALRRSAHPEAISLLTRGLSVLTALPETPERVQQELALQATLGAALAVTKGYAAPEVEHAQQRAFQLCQQIGEAPQLFPVLAGLWGFRFLRAELHQAQELAAQLFRIAESVRDPGLLLWAHTLQGLTFAHIGESPAALQHLQEAITLYDPQLHGPDRTRVGAQDPKVTCLSYAAWTLWRLGYPDQARKRVEEVLTFADALSHPFSLAFALDFGGAGVGMFLRDVASVRAHAEALRTLCHEQGFPYWSGWSDVRQGWVLGELGQSEAGIERMRQGMSGIESTGAALSASYILAQLAEAYGKLGREAEGLDLLGQGLAIVERSDERWYEAELHRLEGELLLQAERRAPNRKRNAKVTKRTADARAARSDRTSTAPGRSPDACFRAALDIARRQQAKSLELRAAMSLSRLWKRQNKRQQARELLGETYGWFSEGFATADLREARALLDELP